MIVEPLRIIDTISSLKVNQLTSRDKSTCLHQLFVLTHSYCPYAFCTFNRLQPSWMSFYCEWWWFVMCNIFSFNNPRILQCFYLPMHSKNISRLKRVSEVSLIYFYFLRVFDEKNVITFSNNRRISCFGFIIFHKKNN